MGLSSLLISLRLLERMKHVVGDAHSLVFRWFQSALSLRGFGSGPIIISFPTSCTVASLRRRILLGVLSSTLV